MQEGADQVPSSNLAMTTPLPALPVTINPALTILNTAKPFARWSTALGMLLSAERGSSGLARKDWRMSAHLSHSLGKLKSSSGRLAISPAKDVAEFAPVLARLKPWFENFLALSPKDLRNDIILVLGEQLKD